MKRGDLLHHVRKHGCHLKREGRSHSLLSAGLDMTARLDAAHIAARGPDKLQGPLPRQR